MAIEKLNPPTLSEPQGFLQVAIARGSRMVFLAGQVSQNADGELIGKGDLAAQTEQALVNVAAGLEAAGATLDDLTKLTLYVADWEESKLEQIVAGVTRAAERLGTAPTAPATLVPVPRLFVEDHLVELDATAVID